MVKMEKFTIFVPKGYKKILDLFVKLEIYPSRSEAVRFAIRDFIKSELHTLDEVQKIAIKEKEGFNFSEVVGLEDLL